MSRAFTRAMPVNLRPQDEAFYRQWERGENPESQVRFLTGVTADSEGVLHRGWRLLEESFPDIWEDAPWRWEWQRHNSLKQRVKAFGRRALGVIPRRVREPAMWVSDTWTFNYHHWVQDSLPRLFLVEELWGTHSIFLPQRFRSLPFVGESLQAFPGLDVNYLNRWGIVRFDDLAVPLPVARINDYDHGIMERLRDRMWRQSGVRSRRPTRRIYLSRSAAACRRAVNEQEVRVALGRLGFETVCAEQLSFGEQVKLFSEAALLVGVHGAGLTNVAWMSPGTGVLEILWESSGARMYFNLASAMGVHYAYHRCAVAPGASDRDDADVVVEPGELVRDVQRLIEVTGGG